MGWLKPPQVFFWCRDEFFHQCWASFFSGSLGDFNGIHFGWIKVDATILGEFEGFPPNIVPNFWVGNVMTPFFGCFLGKGAYLVMLHCTGKGGQAQSLKSAEAPKRQSAKWHRSAKASLSVKASKRHMQRSAKVVRSAGT